VIGVFVGGAAGFYFVVRQALDIQQDSRAGERDNDEG
jgi:hypothetical protein